ncbi:NUDIX domain-containing protein [Bacillus sp. AK031]
METIFRHIARAVIPYKGKILIAQLKGAHSFLPGGGVELGETCEHTLKRELYEELGIQEIIIKGFIGVMEDSYEENSVVFHSISHVFEVQINEDEMDKIYPLPLSKEDHLQFYWLNHTKEELAVNNVLSRSVPELVDNYLTNYKPRFYTDMQHKSFSRVL